MWLCVVMCPTNVINSRSLLSERAERTSDWGVVSWGGGSFNVKCTYNAHYCSKVWHNYPFIAQMCVKTCEFAGILSKSCQKRGICVWLRSCDAVITLLLRASVMRTCVARVGSSVACVRSVPSLSRSWVACVERSWARVAGRVRAPLPPNPTPPYIMS